MGPAPARAQMVLDETSKTVDGLVVYIGLLPAAFLKGHSPSHPESQMHGGVPSGKREFHFVVAVFDDVTGARITNARITATLSPFGLAGARKALEPMKIGGSTTYGQFFDLPGSEQYSIDLDIQRPGRKPTDVQFVESTYHHQPNPLP
jgi:hypothetical protein